MNCKLVLPACAWFTWIQASCYETIHWIHQNLHVHIFYIKYAVFIFCSELNAQDSGIRTHIWLCTWWIQSVVSMYNRCVHGPLGCVSTVQYLKWLWIKVPMVKMLCGLLAPYNILVSCHSCSHTLLQASWSWPQRQKKTFSLTSISFHSPIAEVVLGSFTSAKGLWMTSVVWESG